MSLSSGIIPINIHQFNGKALDLFHDQAVNVPIYASFLSHIGIGPEAVTKVEHIPFLPIRFFKTHNVRRNGVETGVVFRSSGTGTEGRSTHNVPDPEEYRAISRAGFEHMYGPLDQWAVFALLPSYMERKDSSLIHMVDHFIDEAGYGGGFYLHHEDGLIRDIRQSEAPNKLLIGVSFALLDLAGQFGESLSDIDGLVVMETGGMKGRRKEMTRSELHRILKAKLHTAGIHSEYGMTELLSQAYARSKGQFECPPWMKVFIRAVDDPFALAPQGKTGGINVIDLANKDSCAFIATDDLGRMLKNDTFEVLGRFDHSDARGCNLMLEK